MKKLFIVLAVASLGFVACNNEAENKETTDTNTVVSPDTITAPVADTTVKVDTTVIVPTADTTAKK